MPAALKEFSIAAATSPNEPDILHYIAGIYRRQGRWRESLASDQRAQDLDPRNVELLRMLPSITFWCGIGPPRLRVTTARWRLRQIPLSPRSALLTSKCFETAIPQPAEKFCKTFLLALIPMDW